MAHSDSTTGRDRDHTVEEYTATYSGGPTGLADDDEGTTATVVVYGPDAISRFTFTLAQFRAHPADGVRDTALFTTTDRDGWLALPFEAKIAVERFLAGRCEGDTTAKAVTETTEDADE